MKKRVAPTICVSLKPSLVILGCLIGISILSIMALMLAHLSLKMLVSLTVTVIIATIYGLLQTVWMLLPWSWVQVDLNHDNNLLLMNKRQQRYAVQLLRTSVNHQWLVVLHFNASDKRIWFNNTLMLTPWQVTDANQFRRLRVWLKWGNPLSDASGELHQALDALPPD